MEHEAVLVDMHVKPGVPWQLCPRSTLRRLSQSLKKEYGLVRSNFAILMPLSFFHSFLSTISTWLQRDDCPGCNVGLHEQMSCWVDCVLIHCCALSLSLPPCTTGGAGWLWEWVLPHEAIYWVSSNSENNQSFLLYKSFCALNSKEVVASCV
jgi:hypothetical protein